MNAKLKKLTGLACVVLSCAALHGESDSADDLWRTAWSKDELLCDWLSQDAGIAPGKSDLAISGLAYTPKRAPTLELSISYKPDAGHSLMVRKEDAEKYTSFDAFDGKLVGYHSGTLQEQLVEMHLPKVKRRVFDTLINAELALEAGKIDAVCVSVTNGSSFVAAHPSLVVLPLRFELGKNSGNSVAAPKGEVELIAEVNKIIEEVVAKDLFTGWHKAAQEEAAKLGVK